MAARDADERREARPAGRGRALLRAFYGAGLVAIGACLGIVIGSLSETPRLLLERLRGPVETVEVGSPDAVPGAKSEAAPLERFGELQEGKAPKPAAAPAKPAPETPPPPEFVPTEELPTPPPASPPVAAAPPPAAAPPAATAKAPPAAKAPATEKPPAPAAAEPPAKIKPGGAVVQVASYVDRKPADELVVKLESTGFDAYVSQPAAANGRYRVRIRPNAGESAADLAKRLRGFGFDTWATSE